MDVRLKHRGGGLAEPTPKQALSADEIARILGERQQREIRIALGFTECRGLSIQQLEDLYQDTVLALLHRPYRDELHLCRALRLGIKQRALNLHDAERRHRDILARDAATVYPLEAARAAESSPEQLVLAREDRMLVAEFLAELTADELEVYLLSLEKMGYNRIATRLKRPVNDARSTFAACERKRELFVTLYAHGRLCGYRAATIQALPDGKATSEQLAKLAIAHVRACPQCAADHKTNAARLRRRFEEQAAALLPPLFLDRTGWLSRLAIHTRALSHRAPGLRAAGGGAAGLRERAAALAASTGAASKLAAGAATLAVAAGGALAATHTLGADHDKHPGVRVAHAPVTRLVSLNGDLAQPTPTPSPTPLPPAPADAQPRRVRSRTTGHVVLAHTAQGHARTKARPQHEPGGFAYLGVPSSSSSTAEPAQPPAQPPASTSTQTGGGPFSP